MSKYDNLSQEELLKLIEKQEKELKTKKYGLVWDGEREPEQVVLDCANNLPVLKRVKGKEIKTNDSEDNILIKGDNYHALTVLNYTHKEKIDVIYIDPPYNTGKANEWKYNDRYIDENDGFKHSKWLNMMEKRLRIAKELLKDDGIIFLSIGEKECAQLKLLCDKIFNEKNYITNFIWEKTQHFGRQKINTYNNSDYILAYSKNKFYNKGDKKKYKELLVEKIKDEFEDAPLYNASNNSKEITFKKGSVKFNITDGEYVETSDEKYKLMDTVVVKNGFNLKKFRLKFRSRWSDDTVSQETQKGTIFWVKSRKFAIRAIYPQDKLFNESPKQIVFTNDNNEFKAISRFNRKVGTSEEGTSELESIIGEQKIFEYPKPSSLIHYLISLYFDYNNLIYKKDIIILDFFAGSGTTGHAVLELNKEDDGNRKFILCTNNENNICTEVCYPRIEKVIKGYKKNGNGEKVKGLGGNLQYFKTSLIKKTKNKDQVKINLTQKCTEMLCVKENIFNFKKEGQDYKIFHSNKKNKFLCVYYNFLDDSFDEFLKETKKLKGKKIIYMFSVDNKVDKSLFAGVDDFTIEAIPQKILDVYKQLVKMNIPIKTDTIFLEFNKAKNKIFTDQEKDEGARILRIVIEKVIQKIAQNNSINILNKNGKEEKISILNDKLKHDKIFTHVEWEENRTYLAIGNHASHGDNDEYNMEQVKNFYKHIQSLLNNFNI